MVYLAWLLYFGIWAVSFLFLRGPKGKIAMVLLTILSIIDIVYLVCYDLRTLLFVLLATTFAVLGIGKHIATSMKYSFENISEDE